MESVQNSSETITIESIMATLREAAESHKENVRYLKESTERFEKQKQEDFEKFERQKQEDAEKFERQRQEDIEKFERQKQEDAEKFERQKRENDEFFKRQDEFLKRQREDTDRQLKKSTKKLDKQLGNFGNSLGRIIEHLVNKKTAEEFRKHGFVFNKLYRNAVIEDKENNICTEIDIAFENSNYVMIVEAKTKPTIEDIKEHIVRMRKIKAYADLHDDKRKFLGAIAGMVFNENEKSFAMKSGFYVMETSGKTFTVTTPDAEYSPKEW